MTVDIEQLESVQTTNASSFNIPTKQLLTRLPWNFGSPFPFLSICPFRPAAERLANDYIVARVIHPRLLKGKAFNG